MDNDLKHFRPLDPGRINMMDPVELRYWCAELRCSEAQLEDAVARVGEHVAAVRQVLEDAGIGR
jgi:hypothetical protein